jgi:tetratricopeptide (TPR) repeat protein
MLTGCLSIAILALGVRSFIRSGDWSNEETFYKRTFEAGSRSARVAVNLAQAYANRSDYADAERILRFVLDQNPDYPIAQSNLASVLAREGKNDQAEALYAVIEKNSARTRQQYPRSWLGALNLAYVRRNAHNDAAALAILEHAQNDYPEVWELVRLKTEIIRQRDGCDAALRVVQDFAQKNWWYEGAAIALGQLYSQKGNVELATRYLTRASWLDVHDTESLRLLVNLRIHENNLGAALDLQRRAIARQPDQPSQYVLLSNILEKMGRNEEARAALAQVSRLQTLAQAPAVQSL